MYSLASDFKEALLGGNQGSFSFIFVFLTLVFSLMLYAFRWSYSP